MRWRKVVCIFGKFVSYLAPQVTNIQRIFSTQNSIHRPHFVHSENTFHLLLFLWDQIYPRCIISFIQFVSRFVSFARNDCEYKIVLRDDYENKTEERLYIRSRVHLIPMFVIVLCTNEYKLEYIHWIYYLSSMVFSICIKPCCKTNYFCWNIVWKEAWRLNLWSLLSNLWSSYLAETDFGFRGNSRTYHFLFPP